MEQTLNVTQYEPSVDTEDSKKQLILARVWPKITQLVPESELDFRAFAFF